MKKVSVLKLFSLAAFAAAGALGLANAKSVKKAEKLGAANGEWESISLYYAASTQIDGKIAVRRGDTVPGGSISKWGEPILKVGGNYSFSSGKACLGDSGYNNGYSLVMFYAGGAR